MAWENRGNRSYYYRKIWIGGRVVSEYAGTGELAELEAALSTIDRHARNVERTAWQERRKAETGLDRQLADFTRQVRGYVAGVLESVGYHRHDRGHWRKKRMSKTRQQQVAEQDAEQTALANRLSDQGVSVLAGSVLILLLEVGGVSEGNARGVLGELATMRADLAWKTSPLIERLLIEDVCLTWLHMQFVAQNHAQSLRQDGYKYLQAEHYERRLTMAHNRYLSALMALAKVRRLGINVQINIADQQVVAQG